MSAAHTEVLKQEYPETPYTRAIADGYVTEKAIAAGLAVADCTSEYPNGLRHVMLDMRKGHMLNTTPHLEEMRKVLEKHATPMAWVTETPAPKCTVDGVEVVELAVLVKPVAFFVTTQNGTHEVGRCYFQNGVFQYGVDMQRIGGCGTRSVEYHTIGDLAGLRIHFEKGYEMFIPLSQCQGTWRVAE